MACAVALAALAAIVGVRPAGAVVLPPGFADHVVATGLDLPTSFAFLPDGRVLVAEQKTGTIRLVVGPTVAATPLITIPSLNYSGQERGLLAIAVDPGWPVRPYVYAHVTAQGSKLQLLRFTATGTLTAPTSFDLALGAAYVVLDGIPDLNAIHNGGGLRFAPDGRLLYTLGEDGDACQAQDSTSLRGAMLRLDVSQLPAGPGGPPDRATLVCPDNPWSGGPNANARLVWAYGLRNPFRFVVDPVGGTPYVGDVGDNTWEELDAIAPGYDGGWPFREGPALHTWPGCTEPGGSGQGGYDAPIDSYDHNEGLVVIPAGVVRYHFGWAWPVAWDGNVLYADFYGGFLRMISHSSGTWQRVTVPGQPDPLYFATDLSAPVDFAWGPNGDLYWLQQDNAGGGARNAGMLHRIHPGEPAAVPGGSATPRLSLAASPNPALGAVTLRFTLPAGGHARVVVLDVSGRRVATPLDATLPGGAHVTHWDGSGLDGRMAPAGIYLARLESPAGAVTTRLVRMR